MSLYGNFICVDLTIPKVKMDELKEEARSEEESVRLLEVSLSGSTYKEGGVSNGQRYPCLAVHLYFLVI